MPSAGDIIGHYKIVKPIGKGGMGEVYLAEDTVLDRKVAIKFLPEVVQEDPQARKRFLREAKSAAALDHPFICSIYETGELTRKAFIVMEYIAGETLKDRLARGPLPPTEALQLACEMAEAIEEAHDKGIVHRDLKPANIMLTPKGHPKIMDFGLAKQMAPISSASAETMSTAEGLTSAGVVLGTIGYMSPEQARGQPIDARSDIFSFGLVVYEMMSGTNPFQRGSQIDTLSAIVRDAPPPLQVKEAAASSRLRSVLDRALAKDPADRYQSMADLTAELRKLKVQMDGRGLPFQRWAVVCTAALLLGLLIFAGIKLIFSSHTEQTSNEIKPVSVIISDVDNQSGDPAFDGVLEQLLSISLGGAEHISLFERNEAIKLINRIQPDANGRLSEKESRLLCRREGIDLVVRGWIEKDKAGFLVKAAVMDPVSGKTVAAANRSIRAKTDILKAADYLSAKLRADLGVISPDSRQAIVRETFTTNSLEAMKQYADAQRLEALGKGKEANNAYLRAIDDDPNFGRAYAGLAAAYYAQGEWQLAGKYYKDALDRIDQMTEREKHRTRGGYYLYKQNYKLAVEEYTALVRDYPKDLAGHTNLAFAYFLGCKMPEAFQEGLRALELDPDNLDYRYNQSWYALGAGDFDRAKQEARKTLQINPSYAKAFVVLSLCDLAQGQPAEAVKEYHQLEALDKLGTSLANTGLADLAISEGRLNDAEAILKKGITADLQNRSNDYAADKMLMLAQSYAEQGRKALAAATAEQALKTVTSENYLFAAALVYIEIGAEDKARKIAGDLDKKVQDVHQAYGKLIGGYLSLRRGDTTNALKLFQQAQTLVDTWLGRFALGRAYLEAAAFPEACAEFEICQKRKGEALSVFLNDLPTYRYLNTLDYYMGRAQEGQGNKEAERKSFERFLQIRSGSDQVTALISDARRRLASPSNTVSPHNQR